jgi:molybdopterin biosynthesis enzyme
VAIIRGKPIFALPGHPTAAITIFHILCKPLLHKLANFPYNGKKILAKTSKKSFSARGRETFIPVVLEKRFNEWVAEPIELESGAISTFSKADGFYIIPRDQDFINENEMVEVYLFDKSTVNFQ